MFIKRNMFNKVYTTLIRNSTCRLLSRNATNVKNKIATTNTEERFQLLDTRNVPPDDAIEVKFEKKSVLDKCTEDISHVAPYLKPTFNFAAYINKSETLQQLLKMGVNLHKLEQKASAPRFILGLDFEKDVKQYIQFFHDIGLSIDVIADTITKNPYILQQDIEHLKVRINYLIYKKFSRDMILRLLERNPFWLMFSTERIDRRLGFFQKEFNLVGDEVRSLACRQPKLITYSIKAITENTFTLKEEMGFSKDEMKSILLKKPNLLMKERGNMNDTFEYIHNVMEIPLEMLSKFPEVLTCRHFRIKQRHMFLKTLGKAQYNPLKPNYISILTIVSGSDSDFAVNVAKSSMITFNDFLKTL